MAHLGWRRRSPPSGTACPYKGARFISIATCSAMPPSACTRRSRADYTDMIYAATAEEIEERRKAFVRKWRLRHRAVAESLEEAGDELVHLHAPAAEPVEERSDNERH